MSPLCLSAGRMTLIKIYGVNGVKDPKGLIRKPEGITACYVAINDHTPSSASLNVRNFFSFVLRTQAQVWMERRMFQELVPLHQTERSWSNFGRPRQRSLIGFCYCALKVGQGSVRRVRACLPNVQAIVSSTSV